MIRTRAGTKDFITEKSGIIGLISGTFGRKWQEQYLEASRDGKVYTSETFK
jgi:hypothetical protein